MQRELPQLTRVSQQVRQESVPEYTQHQVPSFFWTNGKHAMTFLSTVGQLHPASLRWISIRLVEKLKEHSLPRDIPVPGDVDPRRLVRVELWRDNFLAADDVGIFKSCWRPNVDGILEEVDIALWELLCH